MIQDTLRAKGWTFAHYSPSNKLGPGGNTGEMKMARKEIGHPLHVTGTMQRTDRIWDLHFFKEIRNSMPLLNDVKCCIQTRNTRFLFYKKVFFGQY